MFNVYWIKNFQFLSSRKWKETNAKWKSGDVFRSHSKLWLLLLSMRADTGAQANWTQTPQVISFTFEKISECKAEEDYCSCCAFERRKLKLNPICTDRWRGEECMRGEFFMNNACIRCLSKHKRKGEHDKSTKKRRF